jgi:hypothetical protein
MIIIKSRLINRSYESSTRMQEIFFMIKNNDIHSLDQVSDDLSFIIDQEKFNVAFEQGNKTAETVHKTC